MKLIPSLSTLCVFLPNFVLLTKAELYNSFTDRLSCPDPMDFVEAFPDYDIDCVESSIPPWPMCLFHNVTYFIDAAVSSAARCCDFENLEECRCPLKYKTRWQDIMMDWCPKIEKCPTPLEGIKTQLVTDAWSIQVMTDVVGIRDGSDEDHDYNKEDYDKDDDDDQEYYDYYGDD